MNGVSTHPAVECFQRNGTSDVLFVCEHASNHIPAEYGGLGLDAEVLETHAAYDPGALELATQLAQSLDAPLVSSAISRLVYDCNRAPEALDAIVKRSEIYDIPGNVGLSVEQREQRAESVYMPFCNLLGQLVEEKGRHTALITIHSFTPVYLNVPRSTELGVIFDDDDRLANALLEAAPAMVSLKVDANKPYGPDDGVTHTLKRHGVDNGIVNVMLEIRNDLIAEESRRNEIAAELGSWLSEAISRLSRES